MVNMGEIKAREAAATPGKWEVERDPIGCAPHIKAENRRIAKVLFDGGSEDREVFSNADFVAHAREDIPALIAEVERLMAENNIAESQVDKMADGICPQCCGKEDCDDATECAACVTATLERLNFELNAVKAERDAVAQKKCRYCIKRDKQYLSNGNKDDFCVTCLSNGKCNWQWRGAERSE